MQLDAIYRHGRFTTLDEARPAAHTVGVLGGRVVGLDEEVDGLTAAVEYDLGGAPVVPGFNDAHHHLSMRGRRLRSVDLRAAAAPTMDALLDAVDAAARQAPEGAWVFGAGYDQNKLGDAHPTAQQLDAVSHGHPVWLEHVSGHMATANTAAFTAAGYTDRAGVPDVTGGAVHRDGAGRAVGLLAETAMRLVNTAFLPFTTEYIVESIRVASDQALAEGICSATEPGVGAPEQIGNSPADIGAFQAARASGALRVRMTLMPYLTVLHELGVIEDDGIPFRGLDTGLRTGFGDEWLRIGATKVLTDGSLIGRSAAMTCCYHGEDQAGFLQHRPEELTAWAVQAHRAGWSVAYHAIGDAAVDAALDAFEAAQRAFPRRDPRHRIEHLGVASDAQIARLVDLGVTAVPQGRFISELGDGMIRALGPDRSALCYRMASLLEAGAVLPGSSDAPVVDASPILGIHDMVNRRTAGGALLGERERITAAQALRAWTVGSAYAAKEEDRKGTLARGRLADFTVLSDDLLAVDPARIDTLGVGATVVGGEVAFDDGAVTTG